jgi:hypothetical protein
VTLPAALGAGLGTGARRDADADDLGACDPSATDVAALAADSFFFPRARFVVRFALAAFSPLSSLAPSRRRGARPGPRRRIVSTNSHFWLCVLHELHGPPSPGGLHLSFRAAQPIVSTSIPPPDLPDTHSDKSCRPCRPGALWLARAPRR